LGKQHPDTATSLNNLAALLKAKGDYDDAEPLYKRALSICEKVLGKQHPNTIMCRNNLKACTDKRDGKVTTIGKFGYDPETFSTSIKLPVHNLDFDEIEFLRLLAGSASLSKDEKGKIIAAIPQLTQDQIEELLGILNQEVDQFSNLEVGHGDKNPLSALEKKTKQEWHELEQELVKVVK